VTRAASGSGCRSGCSLHLDTSVSGTKTCTEFARYVLRDSNTFADSLMFIQDAYAHKWLKSGTSGMRPRMWIPTIRKTDTLSSIAGNFNLVQVFVPETLGGSRTVPSVVPSESPTTSRRFFTSHFNTPRGKVVPHDHDATTNASASQGPHLSFEYTSEENRSPEPSCAVPQFSMSASLPLISIHLGRRSPGRSCTVPRSNAPVSASRSNTPPASFPSDCREKPAPPHDYPKEVFRLRETEPGTLYIEEEVGHHPG
jgi:hypothetical protein